MPDAHGEIGSGVAAERGKRVGGGGVGGKPAQGHSQPHRRPEDHPGCLFLLLHHGRTGGLYHCPINCLRSVPDNAQTQVDGFLQLPRPRLHSR